MISRKSVLLASWAALAGAAPALASFHLMQIEQVIGGVHGDTTAQAIQLRLRSAFQNQVAAARLCAFDAAGLNPVVLVDFGASVPSGAAGARILIASTNFVSSTNPAAVVDFPMAALIPPAYLAAGSLTFESDGGLVYWRLSWGGATYTGSNIDQFTNDSDGNFNPPFGGPLPSGNAQALRFTGMASAMSTNNAADYALTAGPAVFRNNAGGSFTVHECSVNPNCDDGVSCTNDTCVSGSCVFTPDNANCPSNGVFCDGLEVCNAMNGCVSPGNPCVPPTPFCNTVTDMCDQCTLNAHCNDGVACTVDTCVSGSCVFTPNNANCPDNGVFCDGSEFCNAVSGCLSSGNPCSVNETCNETMDACDAIPLRIKLEVVATSLSSPVMLTHAGDGSNRLFVVDQAGPIRIIEGGVLLPTPFLDLTSKIPTLSTSYDERGALGLAFHPNYASNGRFFVRYSAPRTGTAGEPCFGTSRGCHSEVLAEYQVSAGDPNVADTTEVILFTVDKPQFNHDGGHVAFGADGLLYFALGDGGGANDGLADMPPSHGPTGNGQNINTALGKMLRIDVDSGSPYAIPASNPFASTAGLDEIHSYGYRNPYRFSFDRGTGALYVADVGQNLFEEVDVVSLGGNYGWVIREGFHCFNPLNPNVPPASCTATGALGEPLLPPVSEYSHAAGGLAIVGGFVYRGPTFPTLNGLYIYGDFSADFGPTGRLYYFETTGAHAYERVEFVIGPDGNPFGKILKGFGEDEDGEIYVLASNTLIGGTTGIVYRLEVCGCPKPPLSAPAPHNRQKNRYVSFAPNNGAAPVAFEIKRSFPMTPGPFTGWIGVPDGNGISKVVSSPVTRAWPEPVVHVGDCEIIPVATYDVRATDDGTTFSAPLSVSTIAQPTPKFWGDTVGAFGSVMPGEWDPPNGVVNVNDYVAALQKFLGLATAPHVTVVDVQAVSSNDPCLNKAANIADVFLIIKAFQGNIYPFTTNPATCPPCP